MNAAGTWQAATVERYPDPAACRFVSGDDFLRLAMQAHLAAGRRLLPPPGEPWDLDGSSWTGAEEFHGWLLVELDARLRAHAIATGHLAGGQVEADPGAGRSPAVKGQGCPALASAVGPAPVPCPSATASATGSEADITLHVDPLFCAPSLQRLPAGESVEILNCDGEKIRE